MIIRALLLFLFFLNASGNTSANARQSDCNLPEILLFSSIRHPEVQSHYQPMIENLYRSLGFDVEMIIVASVRDLKLLESQQLMGSVVFNDDIIDLFPKVVKVQPPLLSASYMLVCKKGAQCNESVITDPERTELIVASSAMSQAMIKHYPELSTERLVTTPEMKNVFSFIRQGRSEYGIYPISDKSRDTALKLLSEFDSIELYSVPSYHVISPSLQCLKPEIEARLKEMLQDAQ